MEKVISRKKEISGEKDQGKGNTKEKEILGEEEIVGEKEISGLEEACPWDPGGDPVRGRSSYPGDQGGTLYPGRVKGRWSRGIEG